MPTSRVDALEAAVESDGIEASVDATIALAVVATVVASVVATVVAAVGEESAGTGSSQSAAAAAFVVFWCFC